MKHTCKYFSWVISLMIYSASSYSATLIVDNGSLMGATGVDVGGVLYDVQFIDGACDTLYNGCDDISDFPFSNPSNDPTLIRIAMTALFEQVLIDSPLGNFDSNPNLINGCFVSGSCSVNTPLNPSTSAAGLVAGYAAVNTTAIDQGRVNQLDHITAGSLAFDTLSLNPDRDLSVFAVWSQTAVVPVQAAFWLFGSGLLGLIGVAKRKA